jgi:glycosyltransferase involved in cell wall biosynthesis
MNELKVSVVIPVYNVERYIERAVYSASEFDCVNEIILIEDYSTDSSLSVCQMLEKEIKKVKLFRQIGGRNLGAAQARNLGIKKSTSDLVSFLDADDFYLDNRFNKDIEILNSEDVDGVYSAVRNQIQHTEYQERFPPIMTLSREVSSKDLFYHLIGLNEWIGYFHLDGFTIKRNSIIKNGIYFEPNLRLHQDTDFIIRCSYHLNIVPSDIVNPVAVRLIHSANRISERFRNTSIRKENDVLLFSYLYQWAKEKSVPEIAETHLRRSLLVREIVKRKRLLRIFYAFIYFIKDSSILLDDQYYYYLHYSLFGNKIVSKWAKWARDKIVKKHFR